MPRTAGQAWATLGARARQARCLGVPSATSTPPRAGVPMRQLPLDGQQAPPSPQADGVSHRGGNGATTSKALVPAPQPTATNSSHSVGSTSLQTYSAAAAHAPQKRAIQLGNGALVQARPGQLQRKTIDFSEERHHEAARSVRIWLFVLDLRLSLYLLDKKWTYLVGGYSEAAKSQRARVLASRCRETILQLGPTFIKLGQLFSSRSDLLSKDFVEELSKLQDRVPAFPSEKALAIIEEELGAPAERLFKEFELQPLAAASLGQVHRATLWDGRRVVVKVQRPGLRRLFDIDLKALKQVARALDAQEEANTDFTAIYQECADVLYGEIDYLKEGRSASRFKRNFRTVPWVRVPAVLWELSSPTVLTLEYMPGVKISNVSGLQAMGVDLKLTTQRATEAYLTQLLKHAFFHADPHPGNIAVDGTGALVFYDFGMMGEIQANVRLSLLEVFFGVYKKDTDRVLNALIGLEVIKLKAGDRVSLKRTLNYLITTMDRQADSSEAVATIGEDLFAVALDDTFRFPSTFTFVLRAFTTLEGVSKALDPDYRFATVAEPYGKELLGLDAGNGGVLPSGLELVQQQAVELGTATAAIPERVRYLEETIRRIEDGDLKPRVRVLESERADRRQAVMQAAQLYAIAVFGFANTGVTFAAQSLGPQANMCWSLAGVFSLMLVTRLWRVQRLDKFEKRLGK